MTQQLLKRFAVYKWYNQPKKNDQESPERKVCTARPSTLQHDENTDSFHNHDIRSEDDNKIQQVKLPSYNINQHNAPLLN